MTSLAGTTNQVNVSAATGAVTLSLPQNIHTGASPTFATLDTGQGANELYAMNQNVRSTDSVTFDDIIFTPKTSATNTAGRVFFDSDDNKLYVYNGSTWLDLTQQGILYTADGIGIELVGNEFQLELDGSTLSKSASGLRISSSYVGQTSITTLGTIATGTWNANTIAVNYGGTGAATFTSNGVLYGNGTGAIQATAAGTNGYVLYSNSGTPAWLPQSSIDAGSISGISSSQFLRSDTSDNFTSGTLTTDAGTTLSVLGDLSIADTNIALTGASTTFTSTGGLTLTSGGGLTTNLTTTSNALFTSSTSGSDSIALLPQSTTNDGAFTGTITTSNLSANRTYTFPNVSGEVSLLGQTISNAELENSTITVSAGTGIGVSGSPVALGGTVTISNNGVTSLAGTTNQVNVSAATGAVTLSLPQNIHTGASPTFATLDTGQGANELYAMNQNVRSTDSVTFDDIIFTPKTSATNTAGRVFFDSDDNKLYVYNGSTWLDLTQQGILYTADGIGIELVGNEFQLELDGSTLSKSASGLRISSSYVGQTSITTLGTIATGTWNANTIAVNYGGTGAATFTSNGVLYGNGTGAIQATAAGTNGYVLYSNSGTPAWLPQSSIDAGSISGISSSQFLRSDTSDNFTSGTLTTDAGTTLSVLGDLSIADTNIALTGASTTFTSTGGLTLTSGGGLTTNLTTTSNALFTSSTSGSDSIALLPQSTTNDGAFTGTITTSNLSANRTYTFPNESGEICLTSGNCPTGSTLTAVGDVTTGDAFSPTGTQGTSLYF